MADIDIRSWGCDWRRYGGGGCLTARHLPLSVMTVSHDHVIRSTVPTTHQYIRFRD